MNILIVNHYAGSKYHGMEYRPYYLAKEWVKMGHSVTIAAATYSHIRNQAPLYNGPITTEYIDGIRYVWLKTPYYKGNGVRRVFNIMSFIRKVERYQYDLTKEASPDVVIASSTYPLDIYAAHKIAQQSKAKLIYEVHDLWPLTPIELGGMSRWNPFIVVLQRAEDYAYHVSDRVVSMLPAADSYMINHGLDHKKFAYLPNGIDIEEWNQICNETSSEHRDAIVKMKRSGKFVVGYVGGHGMANALFPLIEAANRLQALPIAIVLIGQGPEKKALQRRALDIGLKNVVFLPAISRKFIPSILSYMDAFFIGWQKKPIYRFGISPNKLMDYLMAGKPVVHAADVGNDAVAESECGISVSPEDPNAIAQAIVGLMQLSESERENMGQRGKSYVLANHDYKVLAKKFLDLMQ